MANKDYQGHNPTAQFTPVATLHDPLDYLDRVLILGTANFPRTDSLKVGMAALVDDEFMAVTALGPGTVTVNRGCADTVPAKHSKDSLVWFLDTSVVGTDAKEHTAGETNSIKYSPTTIGGSLNIETSGSIDVVTYNYRFARPYPPGALRVNADRWWVDHTLSADTPPLRLSWNYRDRTLEADKLVDHDAQSVGPEPGTTYTVRVYDATGTLRRTYADIMKINIDRWGRRIFPTFIYSWMQAMGDLGGSESEIGSLVSGTMTMFATRNGLDSWQGYTIPFKLNTQGHFIKVGQLATLSAQGDDIEKDGTYPPPEGMFSGQLAQIAAQTMSDAQNGADSGPAEGLYVASLHEGVGQQTSFYTALNRNLFEAPYAMLVKRDDDRTAAKLITVAARPSDRLTDAHAIWTRYDWPHGRGAAFEYEKRVDPEFTPWVTVGALLDYLDTTLLIGRTSFTDGVPLLNVQVGQVALVDAEFIRIDALDATTLTIARGCYDTVPTKHGVGARVWFVEAAAGNDPNAYPYTLDSFRQLGSAAEVKMVPAVYGPPLNLKDVPTDHIDMQHRVDRPYAPGEVLVNGLPWHKGCVVTKDQVVRISWAHRNRDTQGATVVDHHGPTRAPEDGQKYRLSITLHLFDASTKTPFAVKVREAFVDGTEFIYTYSMAQTDGYRSGTLLSVCGRVTVGLTLETVRGDLVSWQSYVIPLALPAYACPPGKPPGGGQLPPPSGGGNGDTGDTPGGGGPGDNNGDPDEPGDNGGGNGNGPPPPPDVPPDWPDPVDPPATPDPDDPNPDLAAHWDTNWDRHWDAYTKDNQGN
jgi:hypothetical protein